MQPFKCSAANQIQDVIVIVSLVFSLCGKGRWQGEARRLSVGRWRWWRWWRWRWRWRWSSSWQSLLKGMSRSMAGLNCLGKSTLSLWEDPVVVVTGDQSTKRNFHPQLSLITLVQPNIISSYQTGLAYSCAHLRMTNQEHLTDEDGKKNAGWYLVSFSCGNGWYLVVIGQYRAVSVASVICFQKIFDSIAIEL